MTNAVRKLDEYKKPTDFLSDLIAYEAGELGEQAMLELFQGLYRSGMVYQLQGHYGRQCAALLQAGLIS